MSPEYLSYLVGVVLALLFAYFPGLAGWFNGKPADVKRLLMLVFTFLTAAGVYGYVCLGLGAVTDVVCTQAGAIALGKVWIATIIANQAAYALLPKAGPNK
jgi:hypothetical protein